MPVMNLLEYATGLTAENRAKPYINMFVRESDVLAAIPVDTLGQAIYEAIRPVELPTVGFRGINEPSTSGTGKVEVFSEPTMVIDHDIDVDNAIVRRHGPERRAQHEEMGATAVARLITRTILKGDNATQPREFSGLQKRSSLFGRTLVNNAAPGGGPLSLANLDTAIHAVSEPTHIIATRTLAPKFIQAARTTAISGFVMRSEMNAVGLPVMSYAGLPILWGYPRSEDDEILPFTEIGAGGGAAQCSSIYVVSFKPLKLKMIQLKGLEVEDLGRLEDGKTLRTHLSWDVSIVDEHKYSFVRLSSITNAAFVA